MDARRDLRDLRGRRRGARAPAAARALVLVALGLSAGAAPAAAVAGRLLPIDQAPRDPALFVFRARLLEACARHDEAALVAALDPGVRTSFGNDGGVAGFRRRFHPERAGSTVWTILAEALALGGAFRGDSLFAAPYVYSSFPEKLDAFQHVAIVGEKVAARSRPSATSPVLERLSFAVVRLPRASQRASGAAGGAWTAVVLSNGARGWVATRYARSPVGWRVILARHAGTWRVAALVSGD